MFLSLMGAMLVLDLLNDAVEEFVIPAATHRKYSKGGVEERKLYIKTEYRGAFTPDEIELYMKLENEGRLEELQALQNRAVARDRTLKGMSKR